jgi:hypothetical protein
MNQGKTKQLLGLLLRCSGLLAIGLVGSQAYAAKPIVHDAEY